MSVLFDTAKPLFGSYTQGQVDGINRIVEYAKAMQVSRLHLAYILATVYHETARWMQPIREGARRYGPAYTDAQSRRAVAAIYAKGIISRNYALPAGPYNQSYYGRGLVQITWIDNYEKFEEELGIPLVRLPDLALDWNYALPILFTGMGKGMFTSHSLEEVNEQSDYYDARAIVNGDKAKYGKIIADIADTFYDALAEYSTVTKPVTEPAKPPISEVSTDEPSFSNLWGFAPAWWPF